MKAAAPVGSTSAWAEVTASGAGRLCAEQNFARSAALGCIKVPSRASKSEIPDEAYMINDRDTHFYVGTIHQHPKEWIIVGLFYPPPETPLPLIDASEP